MKIKYGNLYELGRESHKGFSNYNDLPFYGYLLDYVGPSKLPGSGFFFLEKCRKDDLLGKTEGILVHYASEIKIISFPQDQSLIRVRDVIKIEQTVEITNPEWKRYLGYILLPYLYKKNLELMLNNKNFLEKSSSNVEANLFL